MKRADGGRAPNPRPLTIAGALRRIAYADLPSLEKLTLFTLLAFAKHSTFGGAAPALRTLAACLGRGVTQARAALRGLEQRGLIAPVGSTTGGRAPTTWQLHLERLPVPRKRPPRSTLPPLRPTGPPTPPVFLQGYPSGPANPNK